MIFGPATDGYPIVNYEYAIVPGTQSSAAAAQATKAVLAWAIDPTGGNASTYPQSGQLRGPAECGGVALHQAHRQGHRLAPAGRGPRADGDVRTVAHRGGGRRGCRGREEGRR